MCLHGIVILRQRVDRFHLNLSDSLTTDFAIKTCSFADCWRFKKRGARSYNLFCFSVTITGACSKSVSFIKPFRPPWQSTIFVCCCGLWSKSLEVHRELPDVHGLFQDLKLLVTHFIQYKYGSIEVYRESLVRSQVPPAVQIMQNEKTDTFKSLYTAVSRLETSQNA